MSGALTKFGVKCRALRSMRGMLMVDQARAMKLSSAFISAVEAGVKSIPSDYVDRLAEWLKLSATELQEVAMPRLIR